MLVRGEGLQSKIGHCLRTGGFRKSRPSLPLGFPYSTLYKEEHFLLDIRHDQGYHRQNWWERFNVCTAVSMQWSGDCWVRLRTNPKTWSLQRASFLVVLPYESWNLCDCCENRCNFNKATLLILLYNAEIEGHHCTHAKDIICCPWNRFRGINRIWLPRTSLQYVIKVKMLT